VVIAGCRAGAQLTAEVIECYQGLRDRDDEHKELCSLQDIDYEFADTELCVRLEEHIGGRDIYLIQSLFNPRGRGTVNENYMALLIALRTFREHGARSICAIMPYLAYARQDKPTRFKREPTTARLMADVCIEAGVNRIVVWHPHCRQIQGFYGQIPVTMLEPIRYYVTMLENYRGREDTIVVSPDAGMSKSAIHVSQTLNVGCAIASKFRPSPETVQMSDIIGDFTGKKRAIIIDDIMSSGNTVYEVAQVLRKKYRIEQLVIVVSHNLCSDTAFEVLQRLQSEFTMEKCIVTNSIPQTQRFRDLDSFMVFDLAETIAATIHRIHHHESISELFAVDTK
jgi:ribose-phosphate pyrophosphokinase